jgi:hypothetical protein
MSKATKSAAGSLIGTWSTPIQLTGDDGYYINYIFKRAASIPSTPTGNEASWTSQGWSDVPPAADGNVLWMSKAPHDLRTEEPIDVWSTPIQFEGSSIHIQYSVDGATSWHDTFTTGDTYMRQRVGTGSYSGAIRIVGEDGDYVEYIFKRATSTPSTPTGNMTPTGWYDAPPTGSNPLWMSKGSFDNTDILIGTWSTPVRLDGPGVRVEYSVNGSTSWHSTFTSGDIYMRQSVDDGATWTGAIQIVGEEGAGLEVEYSVDGSTSWHTTFTSGDIYMRQRVQGSSTWSAAIRIVGETGATGPAGPAGPGGSGSFTLTITASSAPDYVANSTAGTYSPGDVVALIADPSPSGGWGSATFLHWTAGWPDYDFIQSPGSASTYVLMNKDISVIADYI